MRGRWIGVCLLLLAAVDAQHAQAQDLTLTATAGLDGVSRPGRWTPIRVSVENRGTDVDGTLIVEWGTARLTQAVALPAPSRRDFELYIRSDDARDVIVVRLESSGRVVRTTEVAVRLAGTDERITACIGSPAPVAGEPLDCTLALSPAGLPRSWRGYDAVDRVEAGPAVLDVAGERQRALDLWRRMRQVEEAGNTAPASGGVPPPTAPTRRVRTTLAMYVLVVSGIGLVVRRRRGAVRSAVIAGVVIAGSAAAVATGRATPIMIRHATVLQQFDGAPDAILHSRAVVELPSHDEFAIRPSLADAALDGRLSREDALEQRFDVDGYPVLSGNFGLGAAKPFSLEASGNMRVLDVAREQGTTRVVNASAHALRECEFPSGFSVRTLESFPPGAHVEAAEPITGNDPIVACRFSGLPLDFVDTSRPVVTDGTSIAVYHLIPDGPGDDPR